MVDGRRLDCETLGGEHHPMKKRKTSRWLLLTGWLLFQMDAAVVLGMLQWICQKLRDSGLVGQK